MFEMRKELSLRTKRGVTYISLTFHSLRGIQEYEVIHGN
jgi:hypothetical protein